MNLSPQTQHNLEKELQSCVQFFLDTYSRFPCSFGLVPDSYPTKWSATASVAGSGYLYPALIIAVRLGKMSQEEARQITLKALRALMGLERVHGWFYHFYDIPSGKKTPTSEVSTIDTALLLGGVLTAAGYFGGEVLELALHILEEVDFPFFYSKYGYMFSMSMSHDGKFQGHWDRYAEQLLLYVIGAANPRPEHAMAAKIYQGFIRERGLYKHHDIICSWHGSLFTYQYSHAYVDFRHLEDSDGVNWFHNSVEASLASYEYALAHKGEFASLHEKSWGLTACANIEGYSGRYGAPPTGIGESYSDGTIAPCGAIGSLPFTPKQSLGALDYFYKKKELLSDYGLLDSYNEDIKFVCPYYLSIDKGISMVMIENFLKGTVWDCFMSLDIIKRGLVKLGFKETK